VQNQLCSFTQNSQKKIIGVQFFVHSRPCGFIVTRQRCFTQAGTWTPANRAAT